MALSDDIKARLDIVDVVAQYVPELKQSGRNFTARCPFHQERSPSFVVFPERQTWRCFGACATGGDLFSFVMKADNVEFTGALRTLAQRAGVSIPEHRREQGRSKHPLLAVNDQALRFFQDALAAERGLLARDYLAKRGVSDESVLRFGLGYSPSTGDELLRHMQSLGITQEQVREAGLVTSPETGTVRDMFRGRLMFTIRDRDGNIVGFAGRALDESNPKYLNTPQTALFDKRSLLYAMSQAKESIAKEGLAVVVEGYMDVIAAHEHGYQNVVASMGTALTEQQVALLKQHAKAFVLALDPDNAGQEATLRSLEGSWNVFGQFAASGRRGGLYQRPDELQSLRIALLPLGKDPDDLIRQDPGQWRILVDQAQPVVEYLFDALSRRTDLESSAGKAELAQRLFPLIAAMRNPYDQDRYFQRLAALLQVTVSTLEASVGRPKPAQRSKRQAGGALETSQVVVSAFRQVEGDPLEERVLSLMLQHDDLLVRCAEVVEEHFLRSENRALLRAIQDGGIMGLDSVKPPEEIWNHFERIAGCDVPPSDKSQRDADFDGCIRRLEERYLRELKAQEEAVLAQVVPGGSVGIEDDRITEVNLRLKEIFGRADP